MTSRDRQAQETRRKLLESAKRLIGEQGYDTVTVDDIVADCGVAKGTFYHYFASKEELVPFLGSMIYDGLRERTDGTRGRPFPARMRTFLEDWHRAVGNYTLHIARLSMKQTVNEKREGVSTGTQIDQGLELIREILKSGIESGELSPETPTDTFAKAIMFSLQGSTIYYCSREGNFDMMRWCGEYYQKVLLPCLEPYLTGGR